MSNFINFLTAGILAAAPLLFGLLGELRTETKLVNYKTN